MSDVHGSVAGVDDGANRVVAAGSDGGVIPGGSRRVRIDVEGEDILRGMPVRFLTAYSRLLPASHGNNGASSGRASARRVTRLSSSQTETRGGARPTRAGLSQRSIIVNERLWLLREKTNRKLRAIARELDTILDGTAHDSSVRSGVRRCTRCKKWAEADWSFCPFDGAPTEEMS